MSSIGQNQTLRLAEELISIKSTSGYEQGAEILDHVIGALRASTNGEYTARIVTPPDAAPYLIAHNHCKKPDFKLVLSGHLDTVAEGSMIDPFTPVYRKGHLHGRGAADMKSGCAAMITAFSAFIGSASPSGEVYLVLTLDEEVDNESIVYALAHHIPKADLAIIGEPSNLELIVSHKGSEKIKVIFQGRACHASMPHQGRNAVVMASRFIQQLEAYAQKYFPERRHASCGEPTISVGAIKGGTDFANIVPDHCEIVIDRRWTPNETIQMVHADIQTIIDSCRQQDAGFQARMESMGNQRDTIYPPLDFSRQHRLLNRITAALIGSGFAKVPQSHFDCWTEGAFFEKAGIPAVVFGPGDINQAHTDTECVETAQVVKAANAYYAIIERFCGS